MSLLAVAHSKRTETVPHWLHQATLEALKKPCETIHFYEGHSFDIGESRNKLTQWALDIPETSHILFVDDDIIMPLKDCLVNMFNLLQTRNEHVVSGLYWDKPHGKGQESNPIIIYTKEENGRLRFAFPFKKHEPPKDAILSVHVAPAGFLLVRREVFEKLPPPWFVYNDPELHAKFDTPDPVGEDVYFSFKARQAGFKLWLDTRARLLHYCPRFVGPESLVETVLMTDKGVAEESKQVRRDLLTCRELRKTANAPTARS